MSEPSEKRAARTRLIASDDSDSPSAIRRGDSGAVMVIAEKCHKWAFHEYCVPTPRIRRQLAFWHHFTLRFAANKLRKH